MDKKVCCTIDGEFKTQKSFDELVAELREFAKERDWEQYHTPENLAKSISIEAAELLECYQWGNIGYMQAISDEVADVMIYCMRFCDVVGIDPAQAIEGKIKKNAIKYPPNQNH